MLLEKVLSELGVALVRLGWNKFLLRPADKSRAARIPISSVHMADATIGKPIKSLV